jgi:hypothetical protein
MEIVKGSKNRAFYVKYYKTMTFLCLGRQSGFPHSTDYYQ